MENKEKFIYTLITVLFVICIGLFFYIDNIKDKGSYDYCVEWIGFSNGTLHRDSLLYTCYSLGSQKFYCDYKILNDGRLEIKNILNVTKNDEGIITEIIYEEPNHFECKRWLKSKR